MPDTTALLSDKRLAEIRAHQDLPRHSDPYVTDYGVAADVVEELLDHLAAREEWYAATKQTFLSAEQGFRLQVAEQLRGLLPPTQEQLAQYDAPNTKEFAAYCENAIRAAAKALGIEL